jgi:Rrf2 family protein
MLSLTRKTDYALLALTYLAGAGQAVVCAREIAERFAVSPALLMNVLKQLSASGLVQSVRGSHGGYALARPAAQITLAELIDATEGPVRLAPCQGGPDKGAVSLCDLGPQCPIHEPLSWLHGRLLGFFRNITLAELVGPGGRTLPPELVSPETGPNAEGASQP